MLYFVTGNLQKFNNANIILKQFDLQLAQKDLPIVEIQSDSLEKIAKYKAQQAYKILQQPLVVKDDGWYITALNGFPRTYMKYMNDWLTVEDFLNLIKPYNNREVIFKDALYYMDGKREKLFVNTIPGVILTGPKGKGVPCATISSFRKDGKTMAQCINEGIHFAEDGASVWNTFAKWYLKEKS